MILQRFLIRLLTMIVTLLGVSVVVFVIIRVAPGDPIAMMLPPGATQADIDRLRALYGLDKSLVEQYFIWLSGVLRGDFGTSISLRQDVLGLVLGRLPATLELSVAALLLAILIGVPLAILGAREQGTVVEAGIDVANGAALSIPDFLWGLVLILLFGVLAPIFHISGRVSPQLDLPFATQFYLLESILRLRLDLTADIVSHMFMPALALALPLAVIGARERGTAVEAGIDVANGAALSIPDFLWGLVLILLFGVLAPVFHISGRISPQLDLPFATQFYLLESILRLRLDLTADIISHMFMPALALALPLAAIISQLLKISLKEVMTLDYVTLARVKGFSETQVILREALKNAALPTLTLIGVQFTFLIGGTVIVERLFSYEGLGNMAIDAVINRDLPLIQGIVLVFALLFVLINLAVDMMYALLNPRLRHG